MLHTATRLMEALIFPVNDYVATGYSDTFFLITPELVGMQLVDYRLRSYVYDSGSGTSGNTTCIVYVKKLNGAFVYPLGTATIDYNALYNTTPFTLNATHSFLLGDVVRFQVTSATYKPKGLVAAISLR